MIPRSLLRGCSFAVLSVALSRAQEKWLEQAWQEIDEEELAHLNLKMAGIPSPTGEEKALALFLVDYLSKSGLAARYQPIDDRQGNAIGRLNGRGDGPELLLYAPIDTAFTGREEEDCPGLGLAVPPELKSEPHIKDGIVVGPGAENPKGYAGCLVAAARAVKLAGVPLKGSLIVGLGAGGMPTTGRPGFSRVNIGHGSGCAFMLGQGARSDFAIIAKPGYAVAWEEVGLCWFKIQLKGNTGYTGVRHVMQYKNPIIDAAKVILGLEEWFTEYTRRNASGLVAPQGSINAFEAGWPHKPAFNPALAALYVDLRISPRTDPMDAQRQLAEALDGIKQRFPEIALDCEMILAIPGSHTVPENWIIQSCIRAWEQVEGRPHVARAGTSGATDANILRSWGIPTARLGMPRSKDNSAPGGFTMEYCPVSGMKQLTKCLIYAIVDTCTRSRQEVGLEA